MDGPFTDFNSAWFVEIAPQIMTYFILSVFTPHIAPTLSFLIFNCIQCCDRGCTFDYTRTTQVIQSSYEQLYIGPEFLVEQRLGQLIALIWTTFFFMPAFPGMMMLLMVITFVYYWFDKVMFLRFYRTSRTTDEKTIAYALHILKYSLLWHALAGTFFLSNQSLLSSQTYFVNYLTDANSKIKIWSGGRFWIPERFAQGHVLVFIGVMFVFLMMLIFESKLRSWML